MEWMFGKKKTPAGRQLQPDSHVQASHFSIFSSADPLAPPGPPCTELLRENKRMLDRAIRDLDRERMGLQQQEKKLIVEIKKMAKDGQMVRATQKPRLEHLRRSLGLCPACNGPSPSRNLMLSSCVADRPWPGSCRCCAALAP